MDKKADKSQAIAAVIVIVIIFLFLKQCNDNQVATSNKIYSTSQEWLDNDSMVKASLQAIVIDVVEQIERVEIDIDRRRFEVKAMNDGIKRDNYLYKYYYICSGQFTEQSNKTIHDFTIGVAFKNDDEMKEQSPYTILYYDTK